MTTNGNSTEGKIGDIECLRAFAILAVLFQHIQTFFPSPPAYFSSIHNYVAGTFGVDLFFVISGFIITRALYPQFLASATLAERRSLLISFWIKRIFRLWPSAWLWLLLILVLNTCFNSSGLYGDISTNIDATLAGVFQYANIRLMNIFGNEPYGTSFVYWSLSLEEQFYFLFPLMLLLFRQHIVFVLSLIVLMQIGNDRFHNAALMMFRTDGLALGALLAIWSKTHSYEKLFPTRLIGSSGTRTVVISLPLLGLAFLSGESGDIRFRGGLISFFSAILVWLASYNKNIFCRSAQLMPILLWIGSRSYALYILHVPTAIFIHELGYRLVPATFHDSVYAYYYFFAALIMVIIATEFNYRFVETPFRRYGKRLSKRWHYETHSTSLRVKETTTC